MINSILKCLIILSAMTSSASAQTITEKWISETNRLVPLTKISVGPDDQFSASVDTKQSLMAYTRRASLVSNIVLQDLKNGNTVDLLPLTSDSQEPQFGPQGRLAFTYFRSSARGDICYVTPKGLTSVIEKDVRCLERTKEYSSSQRSNPFWKSANEIGFLERDFSTQNSRILVQDLNSGKQTVLAEGSVWAPTMQPNGKFLAYNELQVTKKEQRRRLVVKDLASGQTSFVELELPGLSGFPVLSEDEKYVYFSHFLNDTNADRAIDGNDNAVLFRLPVAQLQSASGKLVFPEQLTSSETSCSYPRVYGGELFATCAFEGSLDIYKLPPTGILPASWDQKLVTAAHQSSRTYEERIFLLNSMRFRFQRPAPNEELFFNHLESDDVVAASYYLERRLQDAKAADQNFLRLVQLYTRARVLKNAEPSGEISREFRNRIMALDRDVLKISGEPRSKNIVRGLFRIYLNDPRGAEGFLKKVGDSRMRPLERYLAFELAKGLYGQRLPQSLKAYMSAYQTMMKAPELNEEAHIYYAFSSLQLLQAYEPSRARRIQEISRIEKGLSKNVTALLRSELLSLQMAEAKEEAEKAKLYGQLDKLMNETRNDYFLRKALYVRAIVNFAESADFKYLGFVATNWVRFTKKNDTEFIYAREVFTDASLDQAYSSLGTKNLQFASSFFYQTIILVDDLESHYGYIRSMNQLGQRKTIDERYANLKQREFIKDNMKFVEAILALIDSEGKANSDPNFTGHLDTAISKLESMEQDRDSAIRYLVLGYAEMEKLLRTAKGVEIDNDLYQEANRHLLLAYDLGRDNVRLRISALMNLAILNARVQNHGLAARYFALRKGFPFESPDEQASFAWLYSRALEHTGQSAQAFEEINAVSAKVDSPFEERAAFAAAQKGDFKTAIASYEKFFLAQPNLDQENTARTQTMYGYALLMNRDSAKAAVALTKAIAAARGLKKRDARQNELIDFEPQRILTVAYGLLAQADTSKRIEALEARSEILSQNSELVDDTSTKRILVNLQLAEAYQATNQAKANSKMQEALQVSRELQKENGSLGLPLFQSSVGQLAFAIGDAGYYKANEKDIKALVQDCIKAYDEQKVPQAMLQYQSLKLKMLSGKLRGETSGALLSSPEASAVKAQLPKQWQDLTELSANL